MSNQSSALSINTVGDLQQVSSILAKSGFFNDSRTPEQCFVKVMAGKELGIPAFASMTGIHIIKGKPTLSAHLMAALIIGSKRYLYKKIKHDATACILEFFSLMNDKWESLGLTEFTIEDAKSAGLLSNENWKKFPKNMMFARAVSNGFREFCPDLALGGVVYTPEELGADVDQDGDFKKMKNAEPDKKPEPQKPEPVASEDWKPNALAWALENGISENDAKDCLSLYKDKKSAFAVLKNLVPVAVEVTVEQIEVEDNEYSEI